MHWNQQVIPSLLFYQASHKGRIYSLPKLQKSRRVTVSRPVCLELQAGFPLGGIFLARDKEKFPPLLVEKGV